MNATTPSLTLTIGGETRTYPHSKEGKRQAILDGLAAIEKVTVGEDTYLPDSAALQVVAAVLYPDGIQTREAYQVVQDVTGKACAHLGFGPAEALEPPLVSFARRGDYRKLTTGKTPWCTWKWWASSRR